MQRQHILTRLGAPWTELLNNFREAFALEHQVPPFRHDDARYSTWLLMGGRGAGKTRAGAEWIKGHALGHKPYTAEATRQIALIGQSEHEVREIMIEGVSGVLSVHARHERPVWVPTRRRLEWDNGAVAYAFSAEDPESLRGAQFDIAWADELAKWRYAQETFDMMQFGLRLGLLPKQMITTTPRPIPLIRNLMADDATMVTRAPTFANANNLAAAFLRNVLGRYHGTRLGRQELDGDLIDDRPDALWSRAVIERCRVASAPALQRIVVAVDPPVTSTRRADACGIVAAGRTDDGKLYVLADESVAEVTPSAWATKAVALWRRLQADALVVEVNQGGDMVRAVISEVDRSVTVTPVRAMRGKYLRAEPIATLYEQNRVHHVGAFAQLEDEMCDFGLDGLSSGQSPDRLDALVWALTSLNTLRGGGPRMREL